MKFGLQIIPDIPSRQIVALMSEAESLGYDAVWCADSHLIWREAFSLLGAATGLTDHATLGTAVTNIETRHLTVVASAMATLQDLSGGRMICGVGLGDSALETLGLRKTKRLALEQAVDHLRRLWAGEEVGLEDGTSGRLAWQQATHVPIYFGASGRNMLLDAGRIADGVIVLVGAAPARVAAALSVFRDGADQHERDPDKLEHVVWVACSVADDSREAVNAVRSHAARAITHALPLELSPEEASVADEVWRKYDYYQHVGREPAHASAIPDHIARRFAIAGTPEECAEQVRALEAVGARHLGIIPMGADRLHVARRFAREVASQFQEGVGTQVSGSKRTGRATP